MTSEPGWTVNMPGGRGLVSLADVWRTRELLGFLAVRDFRVRYRQTVIGAAWALLQPILTVAAFTLVFSRFGGVQSEGIPYPVFAAAGLITWNYFSNVITQGGDLFVLNPALITKVYFPRLLIPLAGLLVPLLDLGAALIVTVILAAIYGVTPHLNLVGIPLWLTLLVAVTFGTSLLLSALNVRYRDVRYLLGPLLQLMLFISPVAYSYGSLHGATRYLYSLNPIAGVISLGRWSLLGTPWPGWPLAVSAAVGFGILLSGYLYFHTTERSFADVI